MDVEQEFRSVNYRIKLAARRQALESEARIYGMEPREYIKCVLYAQELTAEEHAKEAAKNAQDAMEAVGASFGRIAKSLADMAASFNRGFIAGMQG